MQRLTATLTAYIDVQKVDGYINTARHIRKAFECPDCAPDFYNIQSDEFKDFVRVEFYDSNDIQNAMEI